WITFIYLILLLTGVPWYWPKDSELTFMGVPAWVFVAIVTSIIASIFTAFILLRYSWSSEIKPDD
ncbi:MAG: hypothetical protein MI865_02195, partial [Proteobacteria bacterium]|nr:hypothetical protein [Pseudomonadota bacterium]